MIKILNIFNKINSFRERINSNFRMKKYVIIVLVLLILGLAGGGYCWYWKSTKVSLKESVEKDRVEVIVKATNEEVLPLVSTNPLDNKPNINPIDQTNPFKDIKTNPFE